MSERGSYDTIARKWLALVERRKEHFIELCDTGRWRHYYTKDEFLEEMRKLLRTRDQWASIAGLPPQSGDAPYFRNVQTPHRLLPNHLVPLSLAPDNEAGGDADLPRLSARANELPAIGWPD